MHRNHKTPNKTLQTGVLLVNLGTPDAPTTSAVRRYLKQFLSDRRVIEVPRIIWFFVLRIILLIRPRQSAKAYREVWTEAGSPLLVISEKQAAALQQTLGDDHHVELGMTYGSPSIAEALERLKGCDKIKILPAYPQYSGTTTGSVFDSIAEYFKQQRVIPDLCFIRSYHNHPLYIAALAQSIEKHWDEFGRADKLVMSFHGIPQRYVNNGDPYAVQAEETAKLVADKLGLPDGAWLQTFQSRVGREPWLQPYTDETMKKLPSMGVKTVDVICPGFSADCLETLEEITGENAEYFTEAGGDVLHYIPCLNDQAAHIQMFAALIRDCNSCSV